MEKESPLEGLVKKIISGLVTPDRVGREEIGAAWEKAAGGEAAKHSLPVSFRRSTLIVNVDGSSWLYELTLKKREILRRLESAMPKKKVKEIRFRIGELKKGA